MTVHQLQVGLALQLASGLNVLHQAGLSTHVFAPLAVDTVSVLPPPSDAIVLNPFRFFSACSSATSVSLQGCKDICTAAGPRAAPEEHVPQDFAACQRQHAFNAQMADVWRVAAGELVCPLCSEGV